jgi:Flp pilus assembly protein TadG
MTRCRHRERGAAAVEFALVAPVFFAIMGIAFFSAHIYEVRSDIQRAAQKTADYGAVQCDYRGSYAGTSGCATGDHRNGNEMATYAGQRFGRNVDFVQACPVTDGTTNQICVTSQDAAITGTVTAGTANSRLEVTLHYHFDSPFASLLKLVDLDHVLVDLTGHGEADVE